MLPFQPQPRSPKQRLWNLWNNVHVARFLWPSRKTTTWTNRVGKTRSELSCRRSRSKDSNFSSSDLSVIFLYTVNGKSEMSEQGFFPLILCILFVESPCSSTTPTFQSCHFISIFNSFDLIPNYILRKYKMTPVFSAKSAVLSC